MKVELKWRCLKRRKAPLLTDAQRKNGYYSRGSIDIGNSKTGRLYRAQRLYVQLLPKSMLLAILIDNGIRLQSTITLGHEIGFFMSYFTRHKGSMSISKKISEHKGCMSISGKSSEHKGCMYTFVL